jgi:peptidoglycan/xylan/chitin deacetylase (PgdA/CDA1 family)
MTEAPNVLTVDVEEWFHICGMGGPIAPDRWPQLTSRVADNTLRLLDLLDRCGVCATFFVLGWVAERYPAIVQRIAAAGHEVGSHGFSHTRVYELMPEGFRQDLDRSVNAIRACGIDRIVGFRAPEWSINDSIAVGARHPDRARVYHRLEHGPPQDRRQRSLRTVSASPPHAVR